MIPFPNKKYQIIYADCPWDYPESGGGNRVVKSKYPTMNIEDIKNMGEVKKVRNKYIIKYIPKKFILSRLGLLKFIICYIKEYINSKKMKDCKLSDYDDL